MRNRINLHPKTQIRDDEIDTNSLTGSAWAAGTGQLASQTNTESKTAARCNGRFDSDCDSPPTSGGFTGLSETALAEIMRAVPYRDAVCTLCEKTVALAFGIPIASFHQRNRSSAEVALARQVAMYLAHTTFSLLLTEIGLHFRRDRTTVSYACAMVEDKRDEAEFDFLLMQLESLLIEARNAMAISLGELLQQTHAASAAGRMATAAIDRDDFQQPQRKSA